MLAGDSTKDDAMRWDRATCAILEHRILPGVLDGHHRHHYHHDHLRDGDGGEYGEGHRRFGESASRSIADATGSYRGRCRILRSPTSQDECPSFLARRA